MKRCSDLHDYLLGCLHGFRLADFQAHLRECASCRKRADEWAELKKETLKWSAGRKLNRPTTAEAARLVVALGPRRVSAAPWFRPAVYAGLASLALTVALFVGTGEEDSVDGGTRAEIAAGKSAPTGDSRIAVLSEPHTTRVEELPIKVLYSEQCEILGSGDSFARELAVPGEGSLVFELGEDRIGLGAASRLKIVKAGPAETRIKLGRGRVAVRVAPKERRGAFTVEAGIFAIKALGTRFEVTMTSVSTVEVFVEEGKVLVEGPGETLHEINGGQVLKFGEQGAWNYSSLDESRRRQLVAMLEQPLPESGTIDVPEPKKVAARAGRAASQASSAEVEPSAKKGPERDLDAWRSMILDGRLNEAETEIEEYLATAPDDASAWSLLANCRRKQRNWEGALEAYRRVMKFGTPQKAASARFDAATILQDKLSRHAEATQLYREYLEKPLLLEAEAMVRLARSLIKLGRDEEARGILERAVERHKGTSAAVEASRLLDGLGN